MIQRLITILMLLVAPLPANAGVNGKDCGSENLHTRITIGVGTDDETDVCIEHPHDQFLTVNGIGISYEEVGYAYQHCFSAAPKPYHLEYDGCVPKAVLKVSGPNQFTFSICNGFGGCGSTAFVHQDTFVDLNTASGKRIPLFQLTRYGKGAMFTGTCHTGSGAIKDAGNCVGDLSSSDIIPEVMQEIASITAQTNDLRSQGRQLSKAEQDKLAALDRALKTVQDKSFEDLTEADLIAFQEARDILLEGKKQSGELLIAINSKIQEIRQRLTDIKTDVAARLGDLGIDLQGSSSYQDAIAFVMPETTFDPFPSEPEFDEMKSVFWILANSTEKSLSDYWTEGDRRHFLETIVAYTDKNDSLYRHYLSALTASPKEQQAYINATQSIDGFLYGDNGYLLRTNWFKDSPVAPELIQAVEDMLSKDANDPFAKKLKENLRLYSGQLDEKQVGIMVFTYTMVKFLDAYKTFYEEQIAKGAVVGPSANPNDLWLTQAKAQMAAMKQEILQTVEWGVDLYVATSPASPAFSLCELVTHRKHCDFKSPRESYSFLENFGRVIDVMPAMAIVPIVKSMKGLNLDHYKIFDEVTDEVLDVVKEADRVGAISKSREITEDLIKKSPALADPRMGVRVLLSYFHEGGSVLVPELAYKEFIEGLPSTTLFGRPDGLFISTKEAMDNLLKESKGSKAFVKQKLGIKPEDWPGIMYRIDIPSPLSHNIRLSSGLEKGANDLFVWGGFTKGGIPEAVTDAIPLAELVITKTELK